MKYLIEIEEVLQRVVEIEANTIKEALDKVELMYKNEDIILNDVDYKCSEFRNLK